MTTLAELLRHVGSDLLQVSTAPRGLERPVTQVRVYDPLEGEPAARDELVLGTGVALDGRAGELFRLLGAAGAAGLVVRSGGAVDPEVSRLAESAGIALMRIPPRVSWVDLLQLLLQALLHGGDEELHSRFAQEVPQDLSVIADELAELVDAPILIQDVNTTVLAYSRRQEQADSARAETIILRRIPEDIVRELRQRGHLAELERSPQPVYIETPASRVGPRLAVAVRAGGDVIGYIWAAVSKPPTPEQTRLLGHAASLVSLHVLRHHLTMDFKRSFQSDLVAAVLAGGPMAVDAAHRLGLAESRYRLVGISLQSASDDLEPALLHCLDLVSFHLRPLYPRAAIGLVGGVVYALLPVAPAKDDAAPLRQSLREFLRRSEASVKRPVLVALSSHVGTLAALPEAREEVDEILRVLRVRPGTRRMAEIDEVRLDGLILRIVDYCRRDPALTHGPIRALEDHDAKKNTMYIETLRAYLNCVGDIGRTGAELGVHANTVRYRLAQLQRISGLDLANPDHLLVASILVRAQVPRS
ncbi:MAG TPA: helix-turn-helix domain-containing protein [Candidatus Dormibacteraeota bacterium]|nr:helix-turn-helix domain-containing protein [Candidatus Dormibacteraeota bacterium]